MRENRAQERDPFSIALERSFGSVPEDETPRLRMSEETVSERINAGAAPFSPRRGI